MTRDQRQRLLQATRAAAAAQAEIADVLGEVLAEPGAELPPVRAVPRPRSRGPARPPPPDRSLSDLERRRAQRELDELRRRP